MAEPNTPIRSATTAGTRESSTEPRNARGSQQTQRAQQQTQGDGGGIVDRVKQSATAQLTNQKDRGIDALGSVAQAVRSSTQRLRDEKHDTIASYVDKAADQIETWSRRLKEKDIDQLLTDVQRLARRQPAVFIGSAFALGLVGARFLKSSRPQNEYSYGSESRRNLHGGGPQLSSAGDRGGWIAGHADTAVIIDEVVISDIDPIEDTSSPRTSGGSRSAGGRRSSSRTERS